jgi:hypothetical protein
VTLTVGEFVPPPDVTPTPPADGAADGSADGETPPQTP